MKIFIISLFIIKSVISCRDVTVLCCNEGLSCFLLDLQIW